VICFKTPCILGVICFKTPCILGMICFKTPCILGIIYFKTPCNLGVMCFKTPCILGVVFWIITMSSPRWIPTSRRNFSKKRTIEENENMILHFELNTIVAKQGVQIPARQPLACKRGITLKCYV
jgi:hypothetical protein